MAERIVSQTHIWSLAAMIRADDVVAGLAAERGYHWIEEVRVQVLDVICEQCRRSYAQVGHLLVCEAAASNDHLIGGTPGVRAKRNHDKHDCVKAGCDQTESMKRAVGWKPGD